MFSKFGADMTAENTVLLIVLSPWIMIFFLFQIWKEIMEKFEHLFFIKEVDGETTKKNGLFY